MWQLPPIYDNLVTDNNHIDGRTDIAPSHWKMHFKIYYLTEKMRSNQDPTFSSLCDRVGRGKITKDDEDYLHSRVLSTDAENCNEAFKTGKISIIVTTNKKRNLVNQQKLLQLLPDAKLYSCNSIDRVMNLPENIARRPQLSQRLKDNPGRTGNLISELFLKIKAPVVLTVNHQKLKYREDGIVNGARGFVHSIQTSKKDPEKVEVIWVVFNNEKIGKLYRFEHAHLRRNLKPGHPLATPILPLRKNFKLQFGSIEYQRTNFPLALSYAITAHKCQGQTLEEVVIDFGVDKEHGIRNYIIPGSFYVALTRVRLGSKLFLRSFDKSYIVANKSIEEKILAMRKFNPYQFKKIYLNEEVFTIKGDEIKIGYLNINGFFEGGHGMYLNKDENLQNIDILVLAETKLTLKYSDAKVNNLIENWNVVARFDSVDEKQHMGILALTSKRSKVTKLLENASYDILKRNTHAQIEALVIAMKNNDKYGFVYCRSKPTYPEIRAMCKYFEDCKILMGDLNLSNRCSDDQEKLLKLCGLKKISFLQEITHSSNINQLDYILINKDLKPHCFATSYYNFISDHNTIVARIGSEENLIDANVKQRITFNKEKHLKRNKEEVIREKTVKDKSLSPESHRLVRKFKNPDLRSCWLNSCLQLILTGLDYDEDMVESMYSSNLGKLLLKIRSETDRSINPMAIKDILLAAEEKRIACRLSDIGYEIIEEKLKRKKQDNVRSIRYDLGSGQQCVRDFFLCLNENLEHWPDVFSSFSLSLKHSVSCSLCHYKSAYETNSLYIEMPVPPNDSSLKIYLEKLLNDSTELDAHCENCKRKRIMSSRTEISSCDDVKFFIVILSRGTQTAEGYKFSENSVSIIEDILIRYILQPFFL